MARALPSLPCAVTIGFCRFAWQNCKYRTYSDSFSGSNVIMQQLEGLWHHSLLLFCCLLHSRPDLMQE